MKVHSRIHEILEYSELRIATITREFVNVFLVLKNAIKTLADHF